MKRIFYTTVLGAMVSMTILSGCKKDFLEVAPQGQLTEEQALIDPAAADKLVGGVYNTLYFQGTVGLKLLVIADVTSDDSDKGSVPSDNGFDGIFTDNFTYGPNTGIFNDVWVDYYKGIGRANKAISILEAGTYDETTKNRLLGEVRFLRGMYYFNLVRMFGGVPKVTRIPAVSEANSDEFQTRATAAEIYAVIEEDLLFGVDHLPMKGEAGSQVGRATKGAAQALLSKVYLYEKKWQQAYDMSLAVMNSGKYDLYGNYANLFREVGSNSIESIFEVQTGPNKTGTTCDAINPNYSNFQGPRGTFPVNTVNGESYTAGDLGFGLNTPSSNLADAYEPGDVRKAGTIIFTSPTTTTTLWDGFVIPVFASNGVANERYNYKGYHSPFLERKACNGINDKDNKPKNIRLIRFAEVLLINAEAATHTGGDAAGPLTRVRARASLGAVAATEANIWKERRVELAMEGDRFFDLVRTGQANAVFTALGKPYVVGKHEVFPIPQAQINFSNGKLTQNNY